MDDHDEWIIMYTRYYCLKTRYICSTNIAIDGVVN